MNGGSYFSSTFVIAGPRSDGPNVSTIEDTPALGAPATTICTASTDVISWTGVFWSSGVSCGRASGWSAGSRQPVPLAIASFPAAARSR